MIPRSHFAALLCLTTTLVLVFPARAAFPAPTNNQDITGNPLTSPQVALAGMHLPPGFKATLFAAEPDVQNPIAMCWDERGRLWIAENFTYSDSKERYDLKLRDRILIFEDTNNDGRFDRRTVFADDLQMLTSIERGFGGVYAMCPPHLLFIPMEGDKPSGPPQILLDGFSTTAGARHTFANGLKWGPDGWLYGRSGITSTSWVDVPGTPREKRQPLSAGLWRYHPTRRVFETWCHGTTNPWGSDWNEQGELFFINTVIGHLWHGIQGAHFRRMSGEDAYPHVYGLIEQHADHFHWDTGDAWSETKKIGVTPSTSRFGGGHAHVGLMIYQGTNFPPAYRGRVFTTNIHGHRVNVDRLEREGSGYVGKHEPDFMTMDDPWFRAVEIQAGPDGGVYILDWSDIGECHENDGVHRESGRIYKITYGDATRPKETNLTRLTEDALVRLQLSNNEWLVRMARWELRERAWRTGSISLSHQILHDVTMAQNLSPDQELRLWSAARWIRSIKLDTSFVGTFPNLDARAKSAPLPLKLELWTDAVNAPIELRNEAGNEIRQSAIENLVNSASLDHIGQPGRLKLASALQVLPKVARGKLAADLLSHAEDATDHNLPLMYWYGIRDLPSAELVKLFKDCRIPLVRQFIARRVGEDLARDPEPLNALLSLASDEFATDIVRGLSDALKGWSKARKPAAWDAFAARVAAKFDEAGTKSLRDLAVLFGSGRALDEVRAIALDLKAASDHRRAALRTLIEAQAPDLRTVCESLIAVPPLSLEAIRGLAVFADPAAADRIVARYPNLPTHERPAALAVLASRPTFAAVLLDSLGTPSAKTVIPRGDLTPVLARQIRNFNDPALNRRLAAVWGEVRESSAEKQQLIATLKAKLTPETMRRGNPNQGRAVFAAVCAACHQLYGEGQAIGPDLTGSGRHDLSYLIDNLADPSAVVAADFLLHVVTLKDGRVFNGMVAAQTDRTLTVRTAGLETTLDRDAIAKQDQLAVSLMPEGLLTALADEQVRDLFSYLMGPAQVPLPPNQ